MNGVHDLGGTDGLGPVVAAPASEPVFHGEWEKAAFALFATSFRAGLFGVDAFRFGIEQMHPSLYLGSGYDEHWLHCAAHYAVGAGVIDSSERGARTHHLEHPIGVGLVAAP